jgi:REP element-mobilizing transposase RayT
MPECGPIIDWSKGREKVVSSARTSLPLGCRISAESILTARAHRSPDRWAPAESACCSPRISAESIGQPRLEEKCSASVSSRARGRRSRMAERTRSKRQRELVLHARGGKRTGAGRPPRGERAGVSHARRETLAAREPALVTLKVRAGLLRLRSRRVLARILPSLAAARERHVRLVHWSVQHDHVHLVVEADSAERLARGMQGLSVRIARRLNALMERRGKVFADRYHARVLRTPRQVRNALAYVLGNARKHGERLPSRGVDPCSSAGGFDGWNGSVVVSHHWLARAASSARADAQSWVLRVGWRRGGGLLDPDHRPGPL